MNYIIEICVAIDIAILSIAYPILIDKISNIGVKYNSEYLPNVFDSEFPQRKICKRVFKNTSAFQITLILTVASFIFKILPLKSLESFQGCFIVENSADILILLLTILLTFFLFKWLNKIMLYQGKASELLKYLINKYNIQEEEDQLKTYLLKTINEFTIYAIEKQDIHLQTSLLDFYYKLFQSYRLNTNEIEGAIYPVDLYSVVNEIIIVSANNKNEKLKILEHRASSGIWLLGESFKFSKISKDTYYWLWRNIIESTEYKKLISNYWATASQYFDYSLSGNSSRYYSVENISEKTNIDKERERFQELNFVLGGLLYYQNKFDTLKYILSFSQTIPPSYPLLPQTMDDIFYWFDYFNNDSKKVEDLVESRYYFPDIDNFGAGYNVQYYVNLYISLLFIRQFTLNSIYIYQDFKNFINLTNVLSILYSYAARLQYFKDCIETVLLNDELLNSLNFIVDKNEILETFDDLKNKIENSIDMNRLQANINADKIKLFNDTANKLITKAFSNYNEVENVVDFDNVDEKNIISIMGKMTLFSKSAFIEDGTSNINYHSIFAEDIVNNSIKYYLPNSFIVAKTNSYIIERKYLLKGIGIITENLKDIVIISLNPTGETDLLIENSKKYKGMIVKIPTTNDLLNDVFFILDKKYLPKFESKDIPQEMKNKFNLNQINDSIKLYTGVIDINLPENNQLKDEYITKDDIELKVLVLISFIFLIKWKKDRKIAMLSVADPFRERGILNKIEDLKSL
ncbi:hypothetical protein [Elizabethkingia ursingii]